VPVVSVKVEDRMKRGMEKYRDAINWPEEIRRFIGGRIEQVEREASIKDVEKLLRAVPRTPKGTASRLVRQDRDSGH
jgi:hypothetical protein